MTRTPFTSALQMPKRFGPCQLAFALCALLWTCPHVATAQETNLGRHGAPTSIVWTTTTTSPVAGIGHESVTAFTITEPSEG